MAPVSMILFLRLLPFLSVFTSESFKIVMPFYVLSTSGHGISDYDWGTKDVAYFFGFNAIGLIVGGQVFALAMFFRGNRRRWTIFIGNIIKYIAGLMAYLITSSLIIGDDHQYWTFGVSMFLLGVSSAPAINQIYLKEYAKYDKKLQFQLIREYGQIKFFAKLSIAVIAPVIYDHFGYREGYATFGIIVSVLNIMCCIAVILGLIVRDRSKVFALKPVEIDKSTQMDVTHLARQRTALDYTSIGFFYLLSAPMWTLLLSVAVCSVINTFYRITTLIVMATEFKISASVAGYLAAAVPVGNVIETKINYHIRCRYPKFHYPYDLSMYYFLVVISCILYATVYQEWLIYTFHIVAHSAIRTLHHLETTSRLQLYPSFLYKQVTAYGFILESISALIAAMALAQIESLPITNYRIIYASIGGLALLMVIVLMMAYRSRVDMMDWAFGADSIRRKTLNNYLLLERILCERIRISAHRRGAITEDTVGFSTLDCIRRNVAVMKKTKGSICLDGFAAAWIRSITMDETELESQIKRLKTVGNARTIFCKEDVREIMREFQESMALGIEQDDSISFGESRPTINDERKDSLEDRWVVPLSKA